MLRNRLIFGLIMIAALIGLIWADDQIGRVHLEGAVWSSLLGDQPCLPAGLLLLAVFLLLVVLGARELVAIFKAKGIAASRFAVMTGGVIGFLMMYAIPNALTGRSGVAVAATLMTLVFIAAMLRHAWRRQSQGAVAAGAVAAFATIYMGLMPGFFLAIRQQHSAWVVAAIIMITKNGDSGAYTLGRLIGRHKLIPWLSPGKTWEGLGGAVLASALTAVVLALISNHFDLAVRWSPADQAMTAFEYPLWYAAVVGMVLGVVGHGGDLLASLLKRDAGIKDSGGSIPGFGGVLDVCDSPMLAAPVAYWLLQVAPTG